jgi:hypothetical protein
MMKSFKNAILVWALIPLFTGVMAILLGPSFWQNAGLELSAAGISDPMLDSQVRFLGTIWFGYGVLLCVCVSDLEKYANLLRGALFLVFLAGIARLVSVAQVGMPDSSAGSLTITAVLVAELVLMPVLIWWQYRVVR